MRLLPFHSLEHVSNVFCGFPSHRLQFCILSRRTRSIVLNSTQLHPISTPFHGHKERFMDFSMAANADVAATDEVQLVPCEQTIHVATIGRNRKHLSCVLALPTDLGACGQMPLHLGLSASPPLPFYSPRCQQSPTKIDSRCVRTWLAHMFHDERQHPRHMWAAASVTTKGTSRRASANRRKAKSTAYTGPQTQRSESVRFDRVWH